MTEYIEREAAIAIIEAKQRALCPKGRCSRHFVYGSDREAFDNWQEIADAIEAIPAADALPVVPRRDCFAYDADEESCSILQTKTGNGFFCAYGQAREAAP